MVKKMRDTFEREINYMRISVTDRCNLRCRYCMPEDGACLKDHNDMLSEDEIIMAAKAAISLGIKKIRITGGEPLIKKNILAICVRLGQLKGLEELCITTNGLLLPKMAKSLVAAGVSKLNISLDTLNKTTYEYLSRRPAPEDVLSGLKAAIDAGFKEIKINTVLIGGVNDSEIESIARLCLEYPVSVRFIELMPMYDSGDFGPESFISSDIVVERLGLIPAKGESGVAKEYTFKDGKGSIGLISPVTNSFCKSCNRIRLTADGHLKPCLHSMEEISIKGFEYDDMKEAISKAILSKPACHSTLSYEQRSNSNRNMNAIGG